MKQITQVFLEGESLTLTSNLNYIFLNICDKNCFTFTYTYGVKGYRRAS